MAVCRGVLTDFLAQENCGFLAADLPGLKSHSDASEAVTDMYLAELARSHGMVLATLDGRLRHPAVELVAGSAPGPK
jgi:predicted nucleic acid-binding protein